MASTRPALVAVLVSAVPAHAIAADTSTDTTVPGAVVTDDTTVWRAENDPSACLNSMPRPDCGYKPQDAGERGGWLQITLFFVMIGALCIIGTVIIRNTLRRDRAIAERLAAKSQESTGPPK